MEHTVRSSGENCHTKPCVRNSDSIFFSCSRKRRDVVSYKFQAAHVVVVSIKENSNNVNAETEVEIFVLDPTSTSLLPDKAFSSETLKNVILVMPESDLPYTLKSVDEAKPRKSTDTDDSGLNIPVVAGGIIAVVVLIGLVFAICLYTRRRRKNNRYIFLHT